MSTDFWTKVLYTVVKANMSFKADNIYNLFSITEIVAL